MPKFTLTINTGDDAFEPDPTPELVRLLRETATKLESGEDYHWFKTILDSNGNDVGRYALKPDDYK